MSEPAHEPPRPRLAPRTAPNPKPEAAPAQERPALPPAAAFALAAGPPGGPGDENALGNAQPLVAPIRAQVEQIAGRSLPVRVHRDAPTGGARAYALGDRLVFAPGQFRPGTLEGDALIAHELAHVAQQAGLSPRGTSLPPELSPAGEPDEIAATATAAAAVGRSLGLDVALDFVPPPAARGLRLQRCGPGRPAPPPITDPFVLGLQAKLSAGNKAGFFADLRALGGSRAGDAAIRDGLTRFVTDGKITPADAFRAVALQELGAETLWPAAVKNFADGLDAGTFTLPAALPPTLPPTGRAALLELSVLTAERAAEGVTPIADYRNRFDAKWQVPPFDALPTAFDPTLDSKGPRNQRARAIFNALYADAAIKTAYDTNTPAGFRALADTYTQPDATNITASPRLQELRALFNPPTIAITGIGDPAFTGFVATVVPKARPLTSDDRDQIRRSHLWRLRAESKFTGAPDVVSQAGVQVLDTILHSFPPAAPGPVVPPAPPAPAGPVPVPNAAQRAWLGGIHLTAPAPSVTSDTAIQSIAFDVRSAVPNPALGVKRRVALDPAAKVSGDPVREDPWPGGIDTMPVTFDVQTDAGAPAGSTVFTAHLTMPPLTTATFAEQTATVTVVDHRLAWFKANVRSGLEFMLANVRTRFAPGLGIRYYGGHLPVFVIPVLPAPNPGLTIFMRGTLKRSGVVLATFPPPPAPPILFDAGARSVILGSTIVAVKTPPSAGPEAMELTIEFVASQVPGAAVLHSIVQPFTLKPAAAVPGGDAALMAADNATLNRPIGAAGSLLHFMSTKFAAGSPEELVAHAVAAGTIKIAGTFVRSDSAAWLRGRVPPIDPTTHVAYAMGAVTDARTMPAVPGAIGWRWPAVPGTVFLNLTPDPTHPAVKRGNAELAGLLAHEGIHAADLPAVTPWERYATEFRAYWIGGLGAGLSTDVDQTMDAKGPKSPRARAIFDHLYNSATYTFVKPNYDRNTAHFRELADAVVSPDGINLTLSQGLRDLRTAVENVAPPYATRKAGVTAKFGLLTPSDRQQVRSNRAWRDLVESKFVGPVPGVVPAVRQDHEIKTILGIPE